MNDLTQPATLIQERPENCIIAFAVHKSWQDNTIESLLVVKADFTTEITPYDGREINGIPTNMSYSIEVSYSSNCNGFNFLSPIVDVRIQSIENNRNVSEGVHSWALFKWSDHNPEE